MHVGFVGVGIMGQAVASNILRGGHKLVVSDKNPLAVTEMIKKGATAGETPMALAAQTDVVITMLPMPSDVEEVVFAADGILAGAREGLIFIDMSTGSPMLAKRMADRCAERGVVAIDCPVGGGEPEAIAGSLLLMAGGDVETIERIRPLLLCIGRKLIQCGGPGAGQAMKLANNMLGAIAYQATSEALSLGMKYGIKLETMLEVLSGTAASNALITRVLPPKALKGDFTPGFKMKLAQKDVGLAVELARQLSVPVPLAALTLQRCATLISSGHGDHDIGVFIKAQADLLDLDIRLSG